MAKTMYPATCDDCGAPIQVPFDPTPGRPVYCREHLAAHRDDRASRPERPTYSCDEPGCQARFSVPFTPDPSTPLYCPQHLRERREQRDFDRQYSEPDRGRTWGPPKTSRPRRIRGDDY